MKNSAMGSVKKFLFIAKGVKIKVSITYTYHPMEVTTWTGITTYQ